ncbi:MAG: hypothetical protein A2166_05775 [Omnitrophica WOR_2 bacterium RBG_13_41_10]|nr:MAG: hypothetical protein A2166_05775 [Omnitrophica WOR_2 bacterium RBG_13_41_10]
MYDLIIIGAGPAGITASVYAARRRLNLLVITKDIGGQAAWSGDIENYTGYQFITGPELAGKFEEHMRKFNIPLKENERVTEIKKIKDYIWGESDKGSYEARAVIIASGKKTKELGVPGEKEFKNKGLTYCAICDGPLFADKEVAVIGGGNSALDAVLQLLTIAKHIYLINAAANLGAEAIMREQVEKNDKVTIMNNTQVKGIFGDSLVKGINISTGKEIKTLAVEGVFVEIGLVPNSEFVQDVQKNERGEIKINRSNETNIPGIFAAGDVTDVQEKQIIIAAGEGSKAALSAFKYLAKTG